MILSGVALVVLASSATTATDAPDVLVGRVSRELLLSLGTVQANTRDGQRPCKAGETVVITKNNTTVAEPRPRPHDKRDDPE